MDRDPAFEEEIAAMMLTARRTMLVGSTLTVAAALVGGYFALTGDHGAARDVATAAPAGHAQRVDLDLSGAGKLKVPTKDGVVPVNKVDIKIDNTGSFIARVCPPKNAVETDVEGNSCFAILPGATDEMKAFIPVG